MLVRNVRANVVKFDKCFKSERLLADSAWDA